MTSKERMLMTIAHQEPDQVPTGEWESGRETVEPILGKGTYRNEWATNHALWQGRRDEVIRDWKTGLVKLTGYYQWGGAPSRALVSETPARVKEIARQNLEACKPSGGFIYATSHSIMPQAKFENYQVMLEILREYGQYEKNA